MLNRLHFISRMEKWKYMKLVLNTWNQKLKFHQKWQVKLSKTGSAVIKELEAVQANSGEGSKLCERYAVLVSDQE